MDRQSWANNTAHMTMSQVEQAYKSRQSFCFVKDAVNAAIMHCGPHLCNPAEAASGRRCKWMQSESEARPVPETQRSNADFGGW